MSAAQKARANLDAIRVLRVLEREGRLATEEERCALALYTGWGDTSVRVHAMDASGRPTTALREALGVDEDADLTGDASPIVAAMRRSVLNAHYTPTPVIRAMWDILLHLGLADVRSPRVLEPSCGVAHFVGLAPYESTDLLIESVTAVELDVVSAAVSRALYPAADVRQGAFEQVSATLPAAFDAVIGNVPFGNYHVHDPSGAVPEACCGTIHDYFVARAVTMLRPGGVCVLITSKGTLDKESDRVRRWIGARADLIGAFRLPSDAFRENAGTEVTTDIVILRRHSQEQLAAEQEWYDRGRVEYTGERGENYGDWVNSYYLSHPDHVLGEWSRDKLGGYFGTGVRRRAGDDRCVGEMIRALIGRLPAGIMRRESAAAPAAQRTAEPATFATAQEMALGTVLRCVRRVVEDSTDTSRRLLTMRYNSYYRAYGSVRGPERDPRHPLRRMIDELWWPLVASLEDDRGQKTAIFDGPIVVPPSTTAPRDAADALYQLIDEGAPFSPTAIAERLVAKGEVAATPESVAHELRGQIFRVGDGSWVTKESYLSGDVVGKAEDAQKWTALDQSFAENVAALAGARPARVPIADIVVSFGAHWVAPEVYISFLRHLFPAFDGWGVNLTYVKETATWLMSVSNKHLSASVENTRTYATERVTALDLIECGLKLRQPVVTDLVPDPDSESGYKTVRNEPETALAQAKLQEIRERWAEWIPKNEARAAALEEEYNRRYNRIVPRKYDGSHLTFPGMSLTFRGAPFSLYAHQRAGALRIVERGEKDDTCLLAYAPGLGKTAAAIAGIVKRLQLGLSKKAVIVVGKNVLHQWQETFAALYPGLADWLLTGTDRAFDARNRRRFLVMAALGSARVVLLTYEQFRSIPVQPATFSAYMRREVEDLSLALGEAAESDPAYKNLQRAFKQREEKLADFQAKQEAKWAKVAERGDADVAWERWGCDLLCVDEFHSFKNDVVATRMTGISGLNNGESQRAYDMRVKLHYITTPSLFPGLWDTPPAGGKGVALTGTPITNSLAEVWVMMRHLQPNLLREMGLWHFDAWASTFTTQVPSPEMDAVGAWRVRTRLKFHNIPELLDAQGLCYDRVDPKTAGGQRPAIVGERMRVIETEGSDALRAYTADLADRAEVVKKRQVDPTVDNMLKITHDGRCASVFNGPPSRAWPHTAPCPACAPPKCDDGSCPVHGWDGNAQFAIERCVAEGARLALTDGKPCATCGGRRVVPHRTKIDAMVAMAWELYCHSDAMSGCQLGFVDLFTPKAASTADGAGAVQLTPDEDFAQRGVYGVIRDKLIAAGMLPEEVAFIHDAASDEERRALFARANEGSIRFLIGSTPKMGLGVNVQRRAYAAHHLTVPWRPDWLDQANKRVDRDGNMCDAVHLICYPTTGSYDVVLWQMIEQKGEFVAQINGGTYAGRSADDIGDLVIDATTAKAVALGDLRVIRKVKLELELAQLQRQFRAWKTENARTRWEVNALPAQIAEKDRELADLDALREHRNANQILQFSVQLRPALISDLGADPSLTWERLADRTAADQRVHVLADSLRHRLGSDGLLIGVYRGLQLLLGRDKDGIYIEARHGTDGHEIVVRGAAYRGGIGTFAQLEAQLASLETQIHRIRLQREIQSKRLESLRSETVAWVHAERAGNLLAEYNELCAAVATAGIVDRHAYKFE